MCKCVNNRNKFVIVIYIQHYQKLLIAEKSICYNKNKHQPHRKGDSSNQKSPSITNILCIFFLEQFRYKKGV